MPVKNFILLQPLDFTVFIILRLLNFETYIFNRIDCFR